jgi:hypothetical protein
MEYMLSFFIINIISFSENTDIYTTRIMNLILFNSLISIKTEISGIFIHVFDF